MSARVFPFPRLFGDVSVRVETIRIDGEVLPQYHINADSQAVTIFSVERREWREVDIDVSVEVPLQELKTKSIDDERTHVLLRINCDATNLRISELAALRAGTAEATLTLRRSLIADRATLECFVVRDYDDGIARIIKEAREWSLLLTEPQARKLQQRRRGGLQEFMEVRWADFADPTVANGGLTAFAREAYYIDLASDQPVLYLNKGLDSYQALLTDSTGSSRAERAFRDLEYRRIALGSWLSLAYEALHAVHREEDSGEIEFPDGWRAAVLERLLPKLFPGESNEAATRKLALLQGDRSAEAYLAGRLQVAINELVGTSATLRKHLAVLSEQ